MRGAKIVVFITGLCGDKCFYCPVSASRLYRDVSFVDEEPASSIADIIAEAYRVGAEGAAITGGDPLLVLERTVEVIRALKEHFGPSFHIHLYTSGRYATVDALRALARAGLDEIRFHPVEEWMLKRVESAVKLGLFTVGAEIPMLPDKLEETKKLIKTLDSIGVEFVNINELEVSPTNMSKLLLRGYRVSTLKPVVEGSEEAALELLHWAEREGLRISLHYCPASYKDSIQMRLRLLRKALRLAKAYERITPTGLLEYLAAPLTEETRRLIEEGYGETVGGEARLCPCLSRRVGSGRLERRYPAAYSAARLPGEVEGVSQQRHYTT